MIFEQLFDIKSSTYTYIISSGKGREALIIDPVIENTNEYLKVLKELESSIFFNKYFNSDITIRSIQHVIKSLRGENLNKQHLEQNSRNSNFRFNLSRKNSQQQSVSNIKRW